MKKLLSIIMALIITLSAVSLVSVSATEDIPVTKITLDKMRLVEDKGTFKILKVYTFPENATDKDLIWTSSNKKVAKVVGWNNCAKLLIKDYGKAKITVSLKSNPDVKAVCNIECKKMTGKFDYKELKNGTIKILEYKGSEKVINVPEKINGKDVTVIESFDDFYDRYAKKITIPKTVKKINNVHPYIFAHVKNIKVHKNNKYFSSVDGVLYDKNVTKLLSYPEYKAGTLIVPKTVKTIEKNAFPGYSFVTSVQLPVGLETIKEGAFCGCDKLKEINIPSTVKTIEPYAFCDTYLMNSVTIPASVKTIGKASFGCYTDETARVHYKRFFTIYSTKGSAAYKYAKKHNLTFKAIK